MECKSCGMPVPSARAELGYDYCLDPRCEIKCHEKVKGVAVVTAHKQGFNVIPLEEAIGENFMDSHGRGLG